jgi:hypothetical protein
MTTTKLQNEIDNSLEKKDAILIPSDDPTSYKQAMESPDHELWRKATMEEWKSLLENHTFEAAPNVTLTEDLTLTIPDSLVPYGIKPIGCKWVYKIKRNPDGTTRNKVRLVIKGYEQVEGIDFNETYAPVSKLTTLRYLLDQAAQNDWTISHMDMVTAFLNPEIDKDDVYMAMPPGIEWIDKRLKPTSVVRLLKALYGLKQAPRLWYQDINEFLLSIGFKQSTADQNLYIKEGVLLLLYVDDLLIVDTNKSIGNGVDTGSIENGATKVKKQLNQKYKMVDLGEARRFLGLEITKTDKGYSLGQQDYINSLVKRFGIENAKPAYSPMDPDVRLENEYCEDKPVDTKRYLSLVGSLMYAALGTRPDISYAVMVLSRYNVAPLAMHYTAAIRVLRYLKTTIHLKLHYERSNGHHELNGYTDADWAGCRQTRKSVGGCIFYGNTKGAIAWQAKSQSVVALSTLEAEYIAASDATREAIWLRRLVSDVQPLQGSNKTVDIACDNQGALSLINTGVVKAKTKHIDIKFHHVHSEQSNKTVKFYYVESAKNAADLLTKPLSTAKHQELTRMTGLL